MAGRKQFDVDEAIERALLTFWRRGFHGTSLDDLVATTGLSRSSIYNAFGGKEDLYLRCLDRYSDRYGRRYEAALANESDPVQAVEAFYRVTLDRIADPGLPSGCIAAQTTITAQALPGAIAARAIAAVESQRLRLRNRIETTTLPLERADALSYSLVGVNQSLAVLSIGLADLRPLELMIQTSLEPLRRALQIAEPTQPAPATAR